jgi:hypothetical protein
MNATPEPTCERCASPLERGDLRCAICGQATPADASPAAVVRVELLRCEGCGAAVGYDAKAQGLACAFCDSVLRLETNADPMEEVEAYLPFRIDRAAARGALRRWQASLGFFRPGDLTSRTRVEQLRPLWWVGWVFDAQARITWAADSNEGSRRSQWAPHSGKRDMVFDDLLVSASRGLSERETTALVAHYDLSTANPAQEEVEGAVVERFDVQRSLARRLVTDALHRTAAIRVQNRYVPGSRIRKLSVAAKLFALDTRRYAFPAWVLTYRYGEDVYRAVVSGQDAGGVVGKAPYSLTRILLAVGAGIAGLVLLLVCLLVVLATT